MAAIFQAMCATIFLALGGALAQDVLELTTSTFDSTAIGSPAMLVAFTAPWCGHCKKLKPEYAKAANTLQDVENADLATVDTVAEQDLYYRFEIGGFPTIKLFRHGVEADIYEGGRDADSIDKYMRERASEKYDLDRLSEDKPTKTKLLKEKATQQGPVVIGCFPETEVPAGDTFQKLLAASVSPKTKRISFATLSSSAVADVLGLPWKAEEGFPKLFIMKPYDERVQEVPTEEAETADKMVYFFETNSWPLVIEFSQEKEQKKLMFERRPGFNRHFIVFLDTSAEGGSEHLTNVEASLHSMAEKYRGDAIFIFLDVAKPDNAPVIGELRVTEPLPAIRLVVSDAQRGKMERFALVGPDSELSDEEQARIALDLGGTTNEEVMDKFFNDWASHKLTPLAKESKKKNKKEL